MPASEGGGGKNTSEQGTATERLQSGLATDEIAM